jgi:hypothetical protein
MFSIVSNPVSRCLQDIQGSIFNDPFHPSHRSFQSRALVPWGSPAPPSRCLHLLFRKFPLPGCPHCPSPSSLAVKVLTAHPSRPFGLPRAHLACGQGFHPVIDTRSKKSVVVLVWCEESGVLGMPAEGGKFEGLAWLKLRYRKMKTLRMRVKVLLAEQGSMSASLEGKLDIQGWQAIQDHLEWRSIHRSTRI